MESDNPLVSVIVPVFNQEKLICNCIESLLDQTYQPIEIIIIDDGSTDNTCDVVVRYPGVKLLTQKHAGPGKARNKGAKKSSGQVLVFVDADMHFDRHFIQELVLPINSHKIVGTFSKNEFVANLDNPWAKAWSLVRGFEDGRMHPANYPDQQAVFRAINKADFVRVGGFDDNRGYDDDWSLSEKLGIKAQAAKGAIFYHQNPDSLNKILRQSQWMAVRKYKYNQLGKMFTLIKLNPLFALIGAVFALIEHKSITIASVYFVHKIGLSLGLLRFLIQGKYTK